MNAVRCNEFTWKEERSELNNKKVKKNDDRKKSASSTHMFLVCYEDQSAHMCSSENSLKPFNNCSVIKSERVRNMNNFRASLKVFANNSRKKKKKERSALAHIYNFFLYVNLHTPFSITQVFALKMKANASDNFIGDKEIISSLFQSSLLVS